MSKDKKKKPLPAAIGSRIWKLFSSLKLTIFLLLTVAAVSIIGTVVEQNKAVEDYFTEYGQKWTEIILNHGY